jgi:hypothetical protein
METPINLNKDEIEILLDALDNEISLYNQYDNGHYRKEDIEYRDALITLANKINKDYQKIFLTTREKPDQTNPDFLEIV